MGFSSLLTMHGIIIGLLPSIASTLAYSIPAGPVGMVWVSKSMRDSPRSFVDTASGLVLGFWLHFHRGIGDGKH